MFEACDEGFIKALVQLLKPQVLLQDDCVFRAHELGDCMYFIQNGCIQIVSADEMVVYSTLIEGETRCRRVWRTVDAQAQCSSCLKHERMLAGRRLLWRAVDAHVTAAHSDRTRSHGLHPVLHDV